MSSLVSALGGTDGLQAQEPVPTLGADATLRPGYHGTWRSDRDGSASDTHDLRMRVQLGGWWAPDPSWLIRVRAAGRFSTRQETLRFYLRDHVPTTDGLRLGEATLDEAHVRWRPVDRLELRVGRMQTSFELAGVPRKSLDRNDSPNTDVTWSDALHTSVLVREGWRQHLIVQRNGRRGPSNAVRSPLDVTGSGSRITLFTAMQLEDQWGPFIQREVDLTYMPKVVPGLEDPGSRGDYLALVLRSALQAPSQLRGGRLVLGTELGLASGTPARALLGTGAAEDGGGDGWAFQLSTSLMGMEGGHSLGVVHSQAGDGWLISPDIRSNNRELEVRYYWQYAPWGRLDVRVRHREDMRMRVDASARRRDRDIYIRTTLRF